MNEDDNRPNLKLISFQDKKDEKEEKELDLLEREKVEESKEKLKLNARAVKLYAESRELFSEMTDYELQVEATSLLRKAFLLAMNPLSSIDNQYDYLEVEYLDEDQ